MKKIILRLLSLVYMASAYLPFTATILNADDIFSTPDILKDNVAFWKKIYTEVSLQEGLLHDCDYPLIIYGKISVRSESSRQQGRIIDNEKDNVRALLQQLNQQPETSWSSRAQEVSALFKKYAPPEALPDAANRIRFQRGQKERFRRGLYLSGAYLDTIKAILAAYNVPQRLAYLPHVESSFLTDAYSKAGAAGLWQFMRSTGKIYMTVNYTIDERRDPIIASVAAAKLLSQNYTQLQSWPLAITAYNHGVNGLKRAVATTGSRDLGVIIQRHQSRSFKFASKNFYSCFLAASEIAQNPSTYFPDITFAEPLRYSCITLDYYISPKTFSFYTDIPIDKLEAFNPAIRPIVFQQNKLIPKGTTIHIPSTHSLETVRLAMQSIPDSLKTNSPPRPKYYTVNRGDNIYAIARRLGVSAQALALENNISRMNRIYAGQILNIPEGDTELVSAPKVAVVMAESLSTTEQPVAKKVQPVKTKPTAVRETIPDTLKEILMATADAVPQPKTIVTSRQSNKFDASIYALDLTINPEDNTAAIHISMDETIGHYADWLAIPTQRIRQINHMGRGSSIQINQKLTIPVLTRESADQFYQRRLEYHMALEEDFYNQYKVTELQPKIIARGETLWDICNANDVIPLWLLKKYNKHIDLAQLFPTMQIWLPVVEEKTETDIQQESNRNWRGIFPAYKEPALFAVPVSLIP